MAYKSDSINVELEALLNVDSSKTFTTVSVRMAQGNTDWVGIGTAKRARGDRYNEGTGVTLAMARALRDLAEDLEAQAEKASG